MNGLTYQIHTHAGTNGGDIIGGQSLNHRFQRIYCDGILDCRPFGHLIRIAGNEGFQRSEGYYAVCYDVDKQTQADYAYDERSSGKPQGYQLFVGLVVNQRKAEMTYPFASFFILLCRL